MTKQRLSRVKKLERCVLIDFDQRLVNLKSSSILETSKYSNYSCIFFN